MKARIRKALKDNKGFTMIELMVVIVIILILAAIAVPTFSRLVGEAKQAAASAEVRTVLMLTQMEVQSQGIEEGDEGDFGDDSDELTWTDILKDAGITETTKQGYFSADITEGIASVTYKSDDIELTLPEGTAAPGAGATE